MWDDIIRAGGNDAMSAHFVGSIVYIERASTRSRAIGHAGHRRPAASDHRDPAHRSLANALDKLEGDASR